MDVPAGRHGNHEQPVRLLIMTIQNKVTYMFLAGIAALVIVLLYFYAFPVYEAYFPKCMFHTITGLHCPGCGTQRAFVAIMHGDLPAALHDNLLALLLCPLLFYSLFVFVYNQFAKKKNSLKIFRSVLFGRIIIISVIVFTVLRNIPVYPFSLLAPL